MVETAHLEKEVEELEEIIKNVKTASLKPRLERILSVVKREEVSALREQQRLQKLAAQKNEHEDGDEQKKNGQTKSAPATAKKPLPGMAWMSLDRYALDGLGMSDPSVTLDFRLEAVGSIPRENITCEFEASAFDLQIKGYNGQNWRFIQRNLEKDIDPEKSKIVVKKNHVVVHLKKDGTEMLDKTWSGLVAKKPRKAGTKEDPSAGLMDMMKDLYDGGDDEMKRMIGEAMVKGRNGETMSSPGGMDGMGM